MSTRKKLCGFSFSINIANFEAFHWTKKLISNLFFLKSVYLVPHFLASMLLKPIKNPMTYPRRYPWSGLGKKFDRMMVGGMIWNGEGREGPITCYIG